MKLRTPRRFMCVRVAQLSASIWMALLSAPLPAAAQGWLPSYSGPGGSYSEPVVAGDAKGTMILAWGKGDVVEVMRHEQATGQWGPVRIAATLPAGQFVSTLTAGVHPATGDAVLVWAQASDGAVQAVHYDAGADAWSGIATLAATGRTPSVGVDSAGNVIALWNAVDDGIEAAVYDRAASSWDRTPPISSSGGVFGLSVSAGGDAVAVWRQPEAAVLRVYSSRFTRGSGTWSSAVPLAPPDDSTAPPDVGLDDQGNAIAVWSTGASGSSAVHAARYAVDGGLWSAPLKLSDDGGSATLPRVAVHASGGAAVVWLSGTSSVATADYDSATDSWGPAVQLIAGASRPLLPEIAMDDAGNAVAAWRAESLPVGASTMMASRRRVGGSWDAPVDLQGIRVISRPSIAFDGAGDVEVAWRRLFFSTAQVGIESRRWIAAPATPLITEIVPGAGRLGVHFAIGERLPHLNLEYSIDGGPWTPRTPASGASPVVIPGLTDGATYGIQLRSTNPAGTSAPSAKVFGTAGRILLPPQKLTVRAITGRTVTIEWSIEADSVEPTGLVLEGGTTPGETLASIAVSSSARVFSFDTPAGAFYLRLRALAGSTRSSASNEVRIYVDVPVAPSPPAHLLGLASGDDLTLAWVNTAHLGAPAGNVLEISGAITASLPLPLTDRFTFSGVPAGTYTFAVRAQNGSGVSGRSNSVTLAFPGSCSPPRQPGSFSVSKAASTVAITWLPPAGGSAPASYVINVSGSFIGSLPVTGTAFFAAAPPGTYTINLAAINPCGSSPPTPSQTVTIP